MNFASYQQMQAPMGSFQQQPSFVAAPYPSQTVAPAAKEAAAEYSEDSTEEEFVAPLKPIVVILLVELCERITYYTLAGTQKIYLNVQLKIPAPQAAAINSCFSMLAYLWCMPGGLLADSIGRYKTIVGAAVVYCFGAALVGVSVYSSFQKSLSSMFLLGVLVLIPLGTGGIKPNIANFGADQIGEGSEAALECTKSYFSWFYMAINVGVFVAFGFIVNTTTNGLGDFVPASEGYFFAYGIGALFMFIAISLFLAFRGSYEKIPGSGLGPIKSLVAHLMHSVKNSGSWRSYACLVGFLLLPVFFGATLASSLIPAESGDPGADEMNTTNVTLETFRVMRGGMRGSGGGGGGGEGGGLAATLNTIALYVGVVAVALLVMGNTNTKYIQEMPEGSDQALTADECKQTFALVPLLVVVNIGYSISYNAMNNAFPSSACQMNLMMGESQLNGAFFNIADAIAIIVFTPLLESVVYPMIARCKGTPVRLGQKIIAGFLAAVAANMYAAKLELDRKAAPMLCGGDSECPPSALFSACAPGYEEFEGVPIAGSPMKDISAYLIFIPFTLIGISEVLVNPCMYVLAYAAPPKVRSLVQAFNLFCMGCLSNAFTAVVTTYTYPVDLDEGHLEYYYFANVVIAFVGILLYFLLTRCCNNGKTVSAEIIDELDAAEEEDTLGYVMSHRNNRTKA